LDIEDNVVDRGNSPDFRVLSVQLAAYALRIFADYGLFRDDLVVAGTGFSMQDFVAKTLGEYATGRIKYHSSKGDLIALLGTALRRDVHDAILRKHSHLYEEARDVAPSGLDGAEKALSEFAQPGQAVDRLFDEEEYKEGILTSLVGEPELKDVAEMVFELGLAKRQEQADFMGITERELDNRKKKLRRRLIERGIRVK
jgi:hypothetical protein